MVKRWILRWLGVFHFSDRINANLEQLRLDYNYLDNKVTNLQMELYHKSFTTEQEIQQPLPKPLETRQKSWPRKKQELEARDRRIMREISQVENNRP